MTEPQPAASLSDFQELAHELEKLSQIIETANDAVVSINQRHEVVYMNRAAEELFGFRREEVLGGDLSPLIPPEHRENHRHYVERFVRTRQARLMGHSAEVLAQRRDGERVPISISFSLAETSGGPLLTAIMRDRSAEHDLAQKVKRAENLAAVGQMVTTVSHEIRTPLTLIGGFASQLRKENGLSPNGQRKLKIIMDEVKRLEGMLSDLNDLARPARYDWVRLDLGEVVEHVKRLMSPELKKGRFRLKLKRRKNLPLVMADRNRISQVLINLINNAIQASVPGDEVEIETGLTPEGGIWLEVRDTGSGIPAKNLPHLFTPFFTTKKRGTGLGLPLARRIMEEHSGTLTLSSQPGQGTVSRLSLPPAPSQAPA